MFTEVFESSKRFLATVTDGLAGLGERVASVSLTVAGVTATVYPHHAQVAKEPEPPAKCSTCGK